MNIEEIKKLLRKRAGWTEQLERATEEQKEARALIKEAKEEIKKIDSEIKDWVGIDE